MVQRISNSRWEATKLLEYLPERVQLQGQDSNLFYATDVTPVSHWANLLTSPWRN